MMGGGEEVPCLVEFDCGLFQAVEHFVQAIFFKNVWSFVGEKK